jgi:ribonucleoside-diphosphate reductase alpha chain
MDECKIISQKITGWKITKQTKDAHSKIVRPTTVLSILAPKRPNELPCDIKKSKIQGESWTFFVGLFDGKPYEIFGGLSKYVDIPNKYKQGGIVKNGKVNGNSTYNLVIGEGDDQMTIKDIASVFENATHGSFTRTLSLALRHGTPVQYVVEQLQKDKHSDITSFATVISRVFKQYIADGTKAGIEQCPGCKAEGTLVYQEGCKKCIAGDCGWSKC